MRSRSSVFLTCLLSLFLFQGCVTSLSPRYDGNWIPYDFDPKKSILLVEKSYPMTSLEKEMEAYMQRHYPYRFEFVLTPTIKLKPGKYNDPVLYRYALVRNSEFISSVVGPEMKYRVTQRRDFNLFNLPKNQDYPPSLKQSFSRIKTFKRVINSLVNYYRK